MARHGVCTHNSIMASGNSCSFSPDSKYFAICGDDGKLKIWQTQNNVLLQEYTQNFHLNTPCSCLCWLYLPRNKNEAGTDRPKKKKKTMPSDVRWEIVAMGTSTGRILLYNLGAGTVVAQLEGGHMSYSITGLSWCPGTKLYSCGGRKITEWDVGVKDVTKIPKRQWDSGSDELCVSVSPDGKFVVSAKRSINLWDADSHKLLRTFIGHMSTVLSLTFVPNLVRNGAFYFVSAAKGDNHLNVWSLNPESGKNAVVTMILQSEAAGTVSVHEEQKNGMVSVAAVTQSGLLHIFSHQLNGLCPKPLHPLLTVQVATDSSRGKESVEPVPVVSAVCEVEGEVRIAYGTGSLFSFENVVLDFSQKLQVLPREDPRRRHLASSEASSAVVAPDTQKAQYLLTSASSAIVPGVKRTHNKRGEVPMEERLENLSLAMTRTDDRATGMPRADNLSQLLLQALVSKDKSIMHTVLCRQDDDVIRNTVRRLPLQVIEPLLKELTSLLHGKTATAQIAVMWLKAVLTIHSAHLMANASLVELLSPVIGLIESRLLVLPSLSRLSGRLELLSSQFEGATALDDDTAVLSTQTGLLLYQDADTSDEDDAQNDNGPVVSESDDHWEELSDSDDKLGDNGSEGGDDDVEMVD